MQETKYPYLSKIFPILSISCTYPLVYDLGLDNKKKPMKHLLPLLVLGLILFGSCKKEEKRLQKYKDENDAAMMKMMDNMEGVTMTEDNDLDFARMMIEHHKGGIEMIDILMKYSKHKEIREEAEMGREMDQMSIQKLEQFINAHGAPVKSADNMAFMNEMRAIMTTMHHNMMVGYTTDPDLDFAKMMIAHHQGAIDMAKVEINRGSDAAAKTEAQEILKQADSIKQLQSFIDSHGGPQNHGKKKNNN